MKKILLLTLLFSITMFGFSQTLSLSWEEGDIEDGGEISILEEPNVDPYYNMYSHIYVTNNSDATINVKVARENTDVIEGTLNVFCWGGLCYGPATDTSSLFSTIEAGQTNTTDFEGHYQPNLLQGTSTITYTFFVLNEEGGATTDQVKVIVNYISGYAGVGDGIDVNSLFSEAYPNPANSYTSFDYDLQGSFERATLFVHNMLGSVVKEIEISNGSGKLNVNTSDLIEGLYFYSVYIDNEALVTRKLVIKR